MKIYKRETRHGKIDVVLIVNFWRHNSRGEFSIGGRLVEFLVKGRKG